MNSKIKLLLVIFILLAVFLVGCGKETPKSTEAIIFPMGGVFGGLIFNVPEIWIEDMEYVTAGGEVNSKDYLIFEKNQTVYAGADVLKVSDEIQSLLYQGFSGRSSPNVINRVDWESYLHNYIVDEMEGAKDISIKSIDDKSGDVWDQAYIASYSFEGDNYRCAYGIGLYVFHIWSKEDLMSEEQLIKSLTSIRTYRDPDEIFFNYGRKEMTGDWEKDSKDILVAMLKEYMALDLPIQRAIAGYKINAMEEMYPANDLPTILDNRVTYQDQSPWHEIYPEVKLYKIDYQLIPYRPDKYIDFAGGGFEITEEGYKHYPERYGIFVVNDFVEHDDLERIYFLGFISPANLAEYGLDASVLLAVNNWYENNIISYAQVLNGTQYVGDVMKVGSLIKSLPMKEAIDFEEGTFGDKAILVHTGGEPYGISINYWIEKDLYLERLNSYLERQVYKNMEYIFSGIKNIDYIIINLHILKDSDYHTVSFRGQRADFPETVYMIRGM